MGGYSMRTSTWRYTERVAWDGNRLRPIWNQSAGVELYDHTGDSPSDSKTSFEQFENENVADMHPQKVRELSAELHRFFDSEPVSPPSPPSPPHPPSPPSPVPGVCGACKVCFNPTNHKCQADGAHRPKTKATCKAKGHIWCGRSTSGRSTSEEYV